MKNLKSTLLTLAALLCSTVASAYDFKVDGIFYNITDSYNLTVEVTYENNTYTGDVVIPTTVIYDNKIYSVTSIGGSAFSDCSSLASITIPNSVTSIGNYAFSGCEGLKKVIIEDGDKDLNVGCISHTSNVEGFNAGTFYNLPLESVYLGRNLKDGGSGRMSHFGYCNKLESVETGNTVTNIPNYTFIYCSNLTSATIGYSVTSIGNYAFCNCSSLASVTLGNSVTSIGERAFYYCSSLASVTLGNSVTSIGNYAFCNCSSLASVTLGNSVTSIGINAFNNSAKEIIIKSTTPPTLYSSSLVSDYAVITVPREAYGDYSTATYWADLLANITIDDARVKNLTLTAEADKSALHMALGDESLKLVTDLTISGTINSFDFMVMRTKMPLLRYLDMTNAEVIYSDFLHYSDYHSDDDEIPPYAFYQSKLSEVKLPKDAKVISEHAFYNCSNLYSVALPKELEYIDSYAFFQTNLKEIAFPETLKGIGECAFGTWSSDSYVPLKVLNFNHTNLEYIAPSAFCWCQNLTEVRFPSTTLKQIHSSAFYGCTSLEEIRIPASVRFISPEAFAFCDKLKRVFVYTIEPVDIYQNTFPVSGSNFVGTLYAPKVSYYNYWYAAPWNQFKTIEEFDEPYENFYLSGDKELNNSTGAINGTEDNNPDAEMGNNSGIIVKDDIEQDLGDVDIEHNGTDGGSIIVGGEGCVNADELHFHINVTGGRWYFFCFPFDVRREDIVLENGAEWVFRYYDGEERAKNGKGGWKNVTSDGNGNHLKAATGYIFQCSKDDVLILTAKNQKIKQEKKYNELVEHITQNAHDASWNFVGNPYLSYYEVTSDDYSAPITVWDGSKYIAIRPGDDDYQLAPFEAFFVQKPEGVANVDYSPEQQMTYTQAQKAAEQARARRRAMPINPDRLLVNITLSNGTDTDQTRVVFNNSAAMGYETACDAAKFETAGMTQLYTVDSRAVKYAINERPVAEGIVTMGYTAPAAGNYTLAAPRMDTPICIKDNLTGTIHDFSEGSYTFMTEAGTFEDRFTIMMKADETGIEKSEVRSQNSEIYDAAGRRVEKMEQGVYIKDNRKVVKM